jgi:hypothetical protein
VFLEKQDEPVGFEWFWQLRFIYTYMITYSASKRGISVSNIFLLMAVQKMAILKGVEGDVPIGKEGQRAI